MTEYEKYWSLDSLIEMKNALEKFINMKCDPTSKCNCYATSFSSDGNYFLVRNDCPVHKGTLS
jgi:hypothetical protein